MKYSWQTVPRSRQASSPDRQTAAGARQADSPVQRTTARKRPAAVCALICMALGGILLGGCRKPAADVDIDLTALSATMVYSEVFNMVYEPENYVGKTVRMEGVCAKYHNQLNGTDYYACIIEDATACCSQGMEFALTSSYAMPDDYPPDGKEIELQGTFEIFEEDGYEFCRIAEATLL